MHRNPLLGLSGTSFHKEENSKQSAQAATENMNTPAQQMQHQFARELKMARENSMVGNYSISVQKYRRVIKMIEKFMTAGCAPPH